MLSSEAFVNKYPLHEAARAGNTSTVESLLGANHKLAFQRDADARLAIHWAVSANHVEIVRLLVSVSDFDPDVADTSGWTPLMIAASLPSDSGDAALKLLLQQGANVNVNSNSGQNALHLATSKENLSIVSLLLDNKCSARVKDRRQQLPIHRAAAIGSNAIIQLLLEKGKSPLNATDSDGATALHHAIAEGHGETALLLLRQDAESDKRDSSGRLAIDVAPDYEVRNYVLNGAQREEIALCTK